MDEVMTRRYTYSKTLKVGGNGETETFTAVEFDSFEEARKVVDSGIKDRDTQQAEILSKANGTHIDIGFGKGEVEGLDNGLKNNITKQP